MNGPADANATPSNPPATVDPGRIGIPGRGTPRAVTLGFLALAWALPACPACSTVPVQGGESGAGIKDAGAGNENRERVPAGTWGGKQAALGVTAEGARLELSCAHGTIDGPIYLDANGGFEIKGSYVQERGGPQRDDEPEDSHPALFSGRTNGKEMTLEIKRVDTNEVVGSFTLVLGNAGRLIKCR